MRRILFFLPDLNGGGAQRTVVNIVNHLDPSRFQPILTVGWTTGPYLDLIHDSVMMVNLARRRVRACILPLAREISACKPDLLFSPYPDANMALLLAKRLAGSRAPIVLRESNNRTAQEVDWGWIKHHLVRWSYHKGDRVVALSNGVRYDLIRRYNLSPENVVTIYNPVDLNFIRRMSLRRAVGQDREESKKEGTLRIISVGRLVRQKGFDLLMRAVAGLKDRHIHLTILGEGPERHALARLVETLELKGFVSMPGFHHNPFAVIRNHDLFVLSSRWEGFGHVIVEAMACGVPVVATRCPSGPEEIIRDGVDGLLCRADSVKDLAKTIGFLADNPSERKRLANAGLSTSERFGAEKIVREYETIFEGLVQDE